MPSFSAWHHATAAALKMAAAFAWSGPAKQSSSASHAGLQGDQRTTSAGVVLSQTVDKTSLAVLS